MRLKRTLSLQNRPTPVGRITGHYQPGAAAAHPDAASAQQNRRPRQSSAAPRQWQQTPAEETDQRQRRQQLDAEIRTHNLPLGQAFDNLRYNWLVIR